MFKSINKIKTKSVEFTGIPTGSDSERAVTIILVSHSVSKDSYVKDSLREFHARKELEWFSAAV